MRQTVVNQRGVNEYFNSKGISLQKDYIESQNFPFGMEVSSSITDLQLNEKRVAPMGKILEMRTLQRMPANKKRKIEQNLIEFCAYVKRFSNATVDADGSGQASKGTNYLESL